MLIDTMTQNVLCRPGHAEEKAVLTDYFLHRKDKPVEAIRQMTWALLASPEFRFNH
jgi:hypothetical protein